VAQEQEGWIGDLDGPGQFLLVRAKLETRFVLNGLDWNPQSEAKLDGWGEIGAS
jgi:hypothetical protein